MSYSYCMTQTITSPLPSEFILKYSDLIRERIKDKTLFTNTCHIWNGDSTTKGNYGIMNICKMKCRVTRVLWLLETGKDPHPYYVLHTCDNPKCVNHEHHFLGDNTINMEDRQTKQRSTKGIQQHNSKLTDEHVRQIRIDLTDYTQQALATYYGVTQAVISSIKTGKRWKHVI